MSNVRWDAFTAPGAAEVQHQKVGEKLHGLMETGHHGAARELLRDYSVDFPEQAEALRLSLVRRYGTGL